MTGKTGEQHISCPSVGLIAQVVSHIMGLFLLDAALLLCHWNGVERAGSANHFGVCPTGTLTSLHKLESKPEVMHESLKVHLSLQMQGDFTEPDTVPSSGFTFFTCMLLSPFTYEETGSEDGDGVGHALRNLGAWNTKCMSAAGVGDTVETSQLFWLYLWLSTYSLKHGKAKNLISFLKGILWLWPCICSGGGGLGGGECPRDSPSGSLPFLSCTGQLVHRVPHSTRQMACRRRLPQCLPVPLPLSASSSSLIPLHFHILLCMCSSSVLPPGLPTLHSSPVDSSPTGDGPDIRTGASDTTCHLRPEAVVCPESFPFFMLIFSDFTNIKDI